VAWKGRTRFIGGHRLIKVWQAPVALVGGRCGGGPGAILAPLFDGTFKYQKAVPLRGLDAAFAKTFGDSGLDLDRRVVFIRGTLEPTKLPASAASLGTIPAQVTLPIACGEITRVQQ
jgi:hypothetical protein